MVSGGSLSVFKRLIYDPKIGQRMAELVVDESNAITPRHGLIKPNCVFLSRVFFFFFFFRINWVEHVTGPLHGKGNLLLQICIRC